LEESLEFAPRRPQPHAFTRIAFSLTLFVAAWTPDPREGGGLLTAAGFELTSVPDSHLCCGSRDYSISSGSVAENLLKNKIKALESGTPALLATAISDA